MLVKVHTEGISRKPELDIDLCFISNNKVVEKSRGLSNIDSNNIVGDNIPMQIHLMERKYLV